MSWGHGTGWTLVAAILVLTLGSVPAVADTLVVHVHDDEALLVGDPTGAVQLRIDQTGLLETTEVGTYTSYTFQIEEPHNRLEIDLRYDPGALEALGPCLRANDLDLYVEGPNGFSRSYPGCDDGDVTLLASDVPIGKYTVRVDAERGSTLCMPDGVQNPCTAPGIEYLFEAKVYHRTG